jgi:hypothetical protein
MRSVVEGARRLRCRPASQSEVDPDTGAAGHGPPPPRFARFPSPYGGGSRGREPLSRLLGEEGLRVYRQSLGEAGEGEVAGFAEFDGEGRRIGAAREVSLLLAAPG